LTPRLWGVSPEDEPGSQVLQKVDRLLEIQTMLQDDEITDAEAAVELGRTLLPFRHSSHRLLYFPALVFADILFQAHQRTKKMAYLDEVITAYRDLRKMSTPKAVHFQVGDRLLRSLVTRRNLLLDPWQDLEEIMQLFAELVVNDGFGEVFHRFRISYRWAHGARMYALPSTSTAYETAMSLMQETLVFSPTLQTQHFLITQASTRGVLPSDYASYQIEIGQLKQAIETLERGRALLWSEMRGLRTSADQLRTADPALAEKLWTSTGGSSR
jgi:hypothetical protein